MGLITCIDRPLIGISGECGYTGTSGLTLDQINISLRKVANAADDQLTGVAFMTIAETNAIHKVISDLKLEISKSFTFNPVYDIIQKPWVGKINVCDVYDETNPFCLKIVNECGDPFRKNKLDWIEINLDSAFNTIGWIIDGFTETQFELTLAKGKNRVNLNYTFENQVGYFWMRLCNGATAYVNMGCNCSNDGHCGCNKCAAIYSRKMIDSTDEQCFPLMDYGSSEFYDSFADLAITNPIEDSMPFNVLGYQLSCLCSYDWLFCQFQNEIAYPVLLQIGIQVYEKAKFTERFNEWVDAAYSQSDYYLEKWLGSVDKFTGTPIGGEYNKQIKAVAEMMVNYIERSGTKCLPCKSFYTIIETLP